MVTRVEVWEHEKSCGNWKHESKPSVCRSTEFEFSQTFTSVTITSWKLEQEGFLFLLNGVRKFAVFP